VSGGISRPTINLATGPRQESVRARRRREAGEPGADPSPSSPAGQETPVSSATQGLTVLQADFAHDGSGTAFTQGQIVLGDDFTTRAGVTFFAAPPDGGGCLRSDWAERAPRPASASTCCRSRTLTPSTPYRPTGTWRTWRLRI